MLKTFLARKPYQHTRFWFRLALGLLILFGMKHCFFSSGHKQTKRAAQAVVLDTAKKQDVPVYLYGLGTVTPGTGITIKTQVNGQLMTQNFTEGQNVKAGQLLAEIDARPFTAQLIQYEGQLLRDKALLENAKIDLARYQTLWQQDSTSQQTLATQDSLVKQYEGAVKIDKGLIAATRLNIEYCKITAPVNGRVGLSQVDPGNYVQTSDPNGIVVLNAEDTISIVFTLPEDHLPQLIQAMQQKKPIHITAFDREQKNILGESETLYLDNQIDPTTGTVNVKADFDNPSLRFFTNQFVNIRVWVDTLKETIVIPTAAIQPSKKGDFVYCVGKDQIAHEMPVTIQLTEGDITSISSGIEAGTSVVVEGADKLVDGAMVTIPETTTTPSGHKHHAS